MLRSYPACLALHARETPDRTAIVCEGESLSYAELERRSSRLARYFSELGVREGRLVTIALDNGMRPIECWFAVWKLGAIPQPVSARLPAAERDAIVELAAPALVIGVPPGSYGGTPCLPVDFPFPDSLPPPSEAPLPDRTSPSAQALTSGGSTGRPKLIVDTQPASWDPTQPFYGNAPGTTVLTPGPLYHAGPFINTKVTILSGGTVVLMKRFDPEQALRAIDEHAVEWVNFVPTMLHRIWRLPPEVRGRYSLDSLRTVTSSGAACPDWLMHAWIDWLGPDRIQEAYGGSERIGGTLITGREWLERPGSVGRPTGGRKIRILDEQGRDLPPGQIGEVFMLPPGGKGSTYRYIGAEARGTGDGWETLGDLGCLDEEGYLYLSDRRTDMIVTGGENVYPAEVESALDEFEAVRSSAVIGLPDPDLGQRVHAIVEAADGDWDEAALRRHLEERLVRYKVPRSFERVDEPLRDDAGKVRRYALREARIQAVGAPC